MKDNHRSFFSTRFTSLSPFFRLWFSLWIYGTVISACAIILIQSLLTAIYVYSPPDSITEPTEEVLLRDAKLISLLIESGIADEVTMPEITEIFVDLVREFEIRDMGEDIERLKWSAIYWSLKTPVLSGMTRLAGSEDITPYEQSFRELEIKTLNSGEQTRFVTPSYYLAAAPVIVNDTIAGVVAYGSSLPNVDLKFIISFYAGLVPNVLYLFATAGIFAGGILAIRIGRIIRKLRMATEGYLKGQFNFSGIKGGKDEIGLLSSAVIRLGAALPTLLNDRQKRGAWEERGKIARNLHDTIKQDMFALSLNTEALQKTFSPEDPRWNTTQDIHAGLLCSIKTLSQLIETFDMDNRECPDFADFIKTELERWRSAGAISDYHTSVKFSIQDSMVRNYVSLIASEAIANAARHARANRLNIRLDKYPEELRLSIRDDGIGISENFQLGFGMLYMKDRAQKLGGTITYNRPKTGGTELILSIPCKQSSAAYEPEAQDAEKIHG